VQRSIVDLGADLKLVHPDNIHITLRFLGNTLIGILGKIHEEMERVSSTSFEIELKGMGAFPNVQRANIIWIGVTKGADRLSDIFAQLEPRIRRLGFPPDNKGFSPHITVARLRSGRNKSLIADFLGKMSDYEFGVMEAKLLQLKSSQLTPQGPVYSTLYEVELPSS